MSIFSASRSVRLRMPLRRRLTVRPPRQVLTVLPPLLRMVMRRRKRLPNLSALPSRVALLVRHLLVNSQSQHFSLRTCRSRSTMTVWQPFSLRPGARLHLLGLSVVAGVTQGEARATALSMLVTKRRSRRRWMLSRVRNLRAGPLQSRSL